MYVTIQGVGQLLAGAFLFPEAVHMSQDPSLPPPPLQNRSAHVHCRQCGYDLTGVAIGGNCPECGDPVTPAFLGQSAPASGKAIASMVLGIVSIVMCMFYGIPAIICGVLAIIFNRLAQTQIRQGTVSPGSIGMAKAGLITGIIGLALGLIFILIIVFALSYTALAPQPTPHPMPLPPAVPPTGP